MYETSLAPLAGVAIPAFYGLYTDDILDVIIMADVGIAIKDWADLNQAQKYVLCKPNVSAHALNLRG